MEILTQREAQVLVFHMDRRTAALDTSGHENRLRVAAAEGLQQLVFIQKFQIQLIELDLCIVK